MQTGTVTVPVSGASQNDLLECLERFDVAGCEFGPGLSSTKIVSVTGAR